MSTWPQARFDMSAEDIALPPVVFILGGPGSGKGTQCEQIIQAAEDKSIEGLPDKIFHINVGGLLRAAQTEYREQVAENRVTEGMAKAGPVLEEMLSQGQILPSWVTVTLMKEEMRKIAKEIAVSAQTNPSYRGGVLIDGFPRSLENLENFESIIETARRLIVITCDDDAMVKRVLSRNEQAGAAGREDDKSVDTIKKRLTVFHSQTKDVLTQYVLVKSGAEAVENKGEKRVGVKVDGDRPISEVTVDFIDAFVSLTTKL